VAVATDIAQKSLNAYNVAKETCFELEVFALCKKSVESAPAPVSEDVQPTSLVVLNDSASSLPVDEFYDEDSLDEDDSADDELMEIEDLALTAARQQSDNLGSSHGRRLSAITDAHTIDVNEATTLAFGSPGLAI
jgi:hypothetical protein